MTGGEGESAAEGIFDGIGPYKPRTAAKREFKPWHKPRKQFVRREQWAREVLALLEADPQAPVRYLGLPGPDLLDVRYLHRQVCGPTSRRLTFLGFNTGLTSGDPDLHVSIDEVLRLPGVDPRSQVLKDDFRRLAVEDSMAWKYARELGPFDVINLDLCDGVAKDTPGESPTLYDAIGQLIALQVRSTRPWSLLLTTRVFRDAFDNDATARLTRLFAENAKHCEPFAAAWRDGFGADVALIDLAKSPGAEFFYAMVTASCKWLWKLGQSNSANKVTLKSSLAYTVHTQGGGLDMVSVALRFEPELIAGNDPTGLSTGHPSALDECASASQMVADVARTVDIDQVLSADPDLHEMLVSETETLLTAARYDVSGYRPWVGL